MSDIYSNSFFVLAAAAGYGCESGFIAGSKRKGSTQIMSNLGSKTDLSIRAIPMFKDPYGTTSDIANKEVNFRRAVGYSRSTFWLDVYSHIVTR